MRSNNPLFLMLSALLALGLTGCGGGGDGDPVLAANAGPDKTVNEGDAVTLEGSGSTSNADAAMTFAWRQIGGAIVDLESNPSSATLMFNAPTTFDPTTQHSGRTLTFELIVSDGNASATDSVSVNVTDVTAPTVTVLPEGGILGKSEKIRIQFNEFVDQDSLVLTGTLADEAEITWLSDAPVLKLSPKTADGEWTSGSDRTLSVKASDTAGNAADPLDAAFLVKLVFENFQAADAVIGQPDMESEGGGLGDSQIGYSYGRTAVHEGRLYIGDYKNDRILGFNTIPTANGVKADFVIGQPDFVTAVGGTSATAIRGPQSVTVHDGKLIVTEYSNDRISIYQPLPTADQNVAPGTIATVVGQADFTSILTTCDAEHLDTVEDSFVTPDGKLIVADAGHNRVLVWNTLPVWNTPPVGSGVSADMVLGQQAFNTCVRNDQDGDGAIDAPAANTLYWPTAVWSDGKKLAVVDSGNNRVLLWNTFPTSSAQAADIVLGQKTFALDASNDSDGDGVTDDPAANTLNGAWNGITSNGEQLFVTDNDNNRLLTWNSWPTSNQQPADNVLGQADFTLAGDNNNDADDETPGAGPTARTLAWPGGIHTVGDRLIVSDGDNNRHLIYISK